MQHVNEKRRAAACAAARSVALSQSVRVQGGFRTVPNRSVAANLVARPALAPGVPSIFWRRSGSRRALGPLSWAVGALCLNQNREHGLVRMRVDPGYRHLIGRVDRWIPNGPGPPRPSRGRHPATSPRPPPRRSRSRAPRPIPGSLRHPSLPRDAQIIASTKLSGVPSDRDGITSR